MAETERSRQCSGSRAERFIWVTVARPSDKSAPNRAAAGHFFKEFGTVGPAATPGHGPPSGELRAELPDDVHQQVDVLLAGSPVHDRRAERHLALEGRGAH